MITHGLRLWPLLQWTRTSQLAVRRLQQACFPPWTRIFTELSSPRARDLPPFVARGVEEGDRLEERHAHVGLERRVILCVCV